MAWIIFLIAVLGGLVTQTQGMSGSEYAHFLWLNFSHISTVVFVVTGVCVLLYMLTSPADNTNADNNFALFICWAFIGSVVGLIGSQMVLVSMNPETWEIVDWSKTNIGIALIVIFGWL